VHPFGEPAHPSGPGRPSTMRVTHTLQSGPGIFSKYLWIKYLRTVGLRGFLPRQFLYAQDVFVTRKTLTLSGPGGT
jgi:hypothetical protein